MATINDVEERFKVDTFIRRTIRFVFIAISPREHGSLTLLILPAAILLRVVHTWYRKTEIPVRSPPQLEISNC